MPWLQIIEKNRIKHHEILDFAATITIYRIDRNTGPPGSDFLSAGFFYLSTPKDTPMFNSITAAVTPAVRTAAPIVGRAALNGAKIAGKAVAIQAASIGLMVTTFYGMNIVERQINARQARKAVDRTLLIEWAIMQRALDKLQPAERAAYLRELKAFGEHTPDPQPAI